MKFKTPCAEGTAPFPGFSPPKLDDIPACD